LYQFFYLFEKSLESLRHLELKGEGNLLVRHIQLKLNVIPYVNNPISITAKAALKGPKREIFGFWFFGSNQTYIDRLVRN
jgi:hypothetical protein